MIQMKTSQRLCVGSSVCKAADLQEVQSEEQS